MDKNRILLDNHKVPEANSNGVKIVGKIDLNQIGKPTVWQPYYSKFRLLDATVEDENGTYDIVRYDKNKESSDCGISLIAGKNGVGIELLGKADSLWNELAILLC